ncbi:MAG: S41 family peptidase [Ignavibacteria bacterium]
MKKILLLILLISTYNLFSKEARMLRYPNSSQDKIVFVYAGDLYLVDKKGGVARKITSYEGYEMFPRFSPDGTQIAFSAEYDGNREVYLMNIDGGEPIRLTFTSDIPNLPERMGPDKIVMGWHPDGERILFRSRHESFNAWIGQLYLVSKDGGMPEKLPLPRGGFASFSPDGQKLAYNRVFREYRTWKRYRGGQADEIWIYDFKTKKTEAITSNDAQDIIPMWYKEKIYYLSDRDGRMNIYVYNTKTKETKKVTKFDKFDVKFPSLGKGEITFENGGFIYLLDCETDKYQKVTIYIQDDFNTARSKILNVKSFITQYEISPDGKRALFTARGEIFTVPAEKGITKNLTNTSGVHERNAVWSPDGKYIAFISDKTGETEIFIIPQDGKGEQIQLTKDADTYRFELQWSPDSKKLLCSDKKMRLYYVDIETKKTKQIYQSKRWEIRDYNWSPDSKWIAFTTLEESGFSTIFLYSLKDDKLTQITSEFFNSFSPVFDSEGKYLFFLSDRNFNPTLGAFERSFVYTNMTKIYGITLSDKEKSPFLYEDDEVSVEKSSDEKSSEKKETKKEDKKSKDLIIDLERISERIFELPVDAGNYRSLTYVDGMLYYMKSTDSKSTLKMFDFKKKKETEFGQIDGYEISANGKKIIYKIGNDYYISDLSPSMKIGEGKLNLNDMTMNLNRRDEWKQIFYESWRQMRDFFYAPNMHGVEWEKVKKNYEELLPYIAHRADLTYLIGEMIGELNAGHAYVGGGDLPKTESIPVGLLGAELKLDPKSGYYIIDKILPGRNWDESTRSPLTEVGIDVKEGDYLLEIDGVSLKGVKNPYELLVNKANKTIRIKTNSKPFDEGAKEFIIKTISSENGLRYFNWVENNRKRIEEATNGKVGYVHIPNMGIDGLNEFVKYFYPQIRKEGLIVDVRYNGGGFVSQMIIERLRRVMTMAGIARNSQVVTTYPSAVFLGPMVCLVNEFSASDGDIFPYQFKKNNLGKVIGKRSWGGVIGIRGSLPFVDGGYLNRPEFANFGVEGEWILEGVGMEPDIVVDNDPALEFEGKDQQLEKALEVIKEEMKKKPAKLPEIPEWPIKK